MTRPLRAAPASLLRSRLGALVHPEPWCAGLVGYAVAPTGSGVLPSGAPQNLKSAMPGPFTDPASLCAQGNLKEQALPTPDRNRAASWMQG